MGRIRSTPARPSSKGKAKVAGDGTVVGGRPMGQGPPHPNLLRGRNRIFGAKVRNPGRRSSRLLWRRLKHAASRYNVASRSDGRGEYGCSRPELMPAELVWVADRLRAGGEIPRDMRRAVREIERQRRAGAAGRASGRA